MIELPPDFDSIFRYIVVVSQRAEQLIKGAKPRHECRHTKPTLIAQDDVDDGLVPWRVLTQEELDAQRQEIVDQYRAEVGADEPDVVEGEAVVDVLPTAVGAAEPELEDVDERDNELMRLQKLLGLAGLPGAKAEDDAEAKVNEDEILVSESEVVEQEEADADDDSTEDE